MKSKTSRPLGLVLALHLLLGLAAAAKQGNSAPSPDQLIPARSNSANLGVNPNGVHAEDWAGIRAAHEKWKHAVQPDGSGWQAKNPGQQWTTHFDRRGFRVVPDNGGWEWGFELVDYGFPGKETRIEAQARAEVTAKGSRVAYAWDHIVEEWWVNDPRGLEHGFTLSQRPPTSSDSEFHCINLTLATRGTLTSKVTDDGLGVVLQDVNSVAVIHYTGLKVWDSDGKELASRFEPAGETMVRLVVDDRHARYPVTIDPIAQQAYLKASNAGASDRFGFAVAVSGETAIVGAPWEASSTTGINSTPNENASFAGAAYVFVHNGTTWTQQAYLKAHQVTAGDSFGYSVAVSGDTVVVGSIGEDSSTTGINSTPNESASLAGAAYVFVRTGTTWSQEAYLKAHQVNETDQFGNSVAVSGHTILVGSFGEDSSTTGIDSTPNEAANGAGAAYVFVRTGTTWSQQAYLKAHQVNGFDEFGWSVAVSGDTLVVGANEEDSNTTGINSSPNELGGGSGAAYVFVRNGTMWSQQAYLKAHQVTAGDNFGWSVAVSGDTLVVGANEEDSNTTGINSTPNELGGGSGAAYVFVRTGTAWSQQAYLKAHQVNGFDEFGWSVAVSGHIIVVGAYAEDSNTTGINSTPNELGGGSGAAYVFERDGTTWTQQAYLKAHQVTAGDDFGYSVAVSGNAVVVGAYDEDSSSTGVNSTPNESAGGAGAAYVFTLPVSQGVTPSLTNIRAAQVPGTHRVEVFYDMTDGAGGTAGSSNVALQVSWDNGLTWPYSVPAAPPNSEGDLGPSVSWGTNKKITWNAGANWPALQPKFSKQIKFRVIAGTSPDTTSATSHQTMIDVENPDIEALVKVVDDAIPGLNEETENWGAMRTRSKRGVFFSVGPRLDPFGTDHQFLLLPRTGTQQNWVIDNAYDAGTEVPLFFVNDERFQPFPTVTWSTTTQEFRFAQASGVEFRDQLNLPVADYFKATSLYKRVKLPRGVMDLDYNSTPTSLDWLTDSRELNPNANKLVVVIHGWAPGADSDPYTFEDQPWGKNGFRPLLEEIHTRIVLGETPSLVRPALQGVWDLYAYNWIEDARTGGNLTITDLDRHAAGGVGTPVENGTQAAELAYQHGLALGKLLRAKYGTSLQKVHFIGHSAGTWVARSASLYLQATKETSELKQQVTLLDPFNPTVGYQDWVGEGGEDSVLGTPDIEAWRTSATAVRYENIYSTDLFVTGTNGRYWGGADEAVSGGVSTSNLKVGFTVAGDNGSGLLDGSMWDGHGGPVFYYAYSVNSENPATYTIGDQNDEADRASKLFRWFGSKPFVETAGWDLSLHQAEVNEAMMTVAQGVTLTQEVWNRQFSYQGTIVPPPAVDSFAAETTSASGWQRIMVDVSESGWVRLLLFPTAGGPAEAVGPLRIDGSGRFSITLTDGSTFAGQFDLSQTPVTISFTHAGVPLPGTAQAVGGSSPYAGVTGSIDDAGNAALIMVLKDGTAGGLVQAIDVGGAEWAGSGIGVVDAQGHLLITGSGGFTISANVESGGQTTTFPVVTPPSGVITTVVGPVSQNVPPSGSSYVVSVASTGMWTVQNNPTWLTATPSATSGNGTVAVNVSANTGVSARQAVITIGGQIHVVNQAGQAAALPSPLLHLPLDGNVNDASGNGHVPTGSGLTYGADRNGGTNGAAYFGNANAYGTSGISVPNASALNPASYTLVGWIKPTSNGYNSNQDWAVIVRKGVQFRYGLFTNVTTRNPFGGFYPGTNSQISGPAALNLNQWHHLALSYSSGTVKLYVDGQLANQSSGTGNLPAASTAAISIGSGNFDSIWSAYQGWMDDIRLYGEALTGSQVQQLQSGSTSNGLLTSWRQQFFGSTGGTGNGADDADPEGDGVPNLIEFFQGTAPNAGNGEPPLNQLVRQTTGQVTFRYRRSKTALGVAGQVLWSPDLINWAGNGGTIGGTRVVFTEQIVDDQPTHQVVQVTGFMTPSSTQKIFLRLAATAAP